MCPYCCVLIQTRVSMRENISMKYGTSLLYIRQKQSNNSPSLNKKSKKRINKTTFVYNVQKQHTKIVKDFD